VLALDDGEEITAVVNTSELEADRYLAMATRGGYVKRTKVSDFQNIYSNGIRATTLDEHDSLVDVVLTDGSMDLMIGTSQGMTIRFDETEARVMGRTARGVNGIKLQDGDRVAGMVATHEREGECLLTVTRNGFGKCTPLDAYRRQSRYGKGLIDIRTDSRNGEVVSLNTVDRDAGLVLMSDRGQIMRTEASEISTVGRNTKGVTIMDLEEDWVAGVDVESTAGIADD
jgi:DNA gyrase subunit A